MTLDELHAIDPLAKWASLSSEVQASIIRPLLTCAFAEVCQDDDGTDCSSGDQNVAAGIVQNRYQAMWDAMKVAFIDILGDDLTALHAGPTADMIDDSGKVLVKGLRGKRKLHAPSRSDLHICLSGKKVAIVGFKNIGTEDAPLWQAWTQREVDDERVRRHPGQAYGPFLPAFASVLAPATLGVTNHHEDHSYDRAA